MGVELLLEHFDCSSAKNHLLPLEAEPRKFDPYFQIFDLGLVELSGRQQSIPDIDVLRGAA